MTAALALPRVGELVGDRFRLLGELGEGGMATVFRAHDAVTEQEVALKLLAPRYVGRGVRERRLIDEAIYLRRIGDHPNLLRLIDAGVLAPSGWPWLCTEVMHGQDLGWLLVKGKLPPQRAIPIAGQVADALLACHRAGVVHRDLTPHNIFVLEGSGDTVKLFDFGHAAALGGPELAAGERGRLTGVHDVPGSLGYIGPEQAQNAPPDPAMDVFSFGVLLAEMITGRNPYERFADRSAFIRAQREGTLDPISIQPWAYAIPEGLAEIVRSCTAPVADRPSMACARELLGRVAASLSATTDDSAGVHEKDEKDENDETVRFDAISTIVSHQHERRDALIGAWGPPPVTTAAREPAVSVMDSSPPTTVHPGEDEDELGSKATAEAARPELAFARPPHLRGDDLAPPSPSFEPASLPPASKQPVEEEAFTPPKRQRESKRRAWGLPGILLLLLLGAATWWTWGRFEPETPGLQSAEQTESPGPSTDTDPGPNLTGENPNPDHEFVSDAPRDESPATAPLDLPGPKPKPRPRPECDGIESKGRAAFGEREWSKVVTHTARKRCWGSRRERAKIRAQALFHLGRWGECVRVGAHVSDPKTKALVQKCRDFAAKP